MPLWSDVLNVDSMSPSTAYTSLTLTRLTDPNINPKRANPPKPLTSRFAAGVARDILVCITATATSWIDLNAKTSYWLARKPLCIEVAWVLDALTWGLHCMRKRRRNPRHKLNWLETTVLITKTSLWLDLYCMRKRRWNPCPKLNWLD